MSSIIFTDDWTAVNHITRLDLENTPLEIKTNSTLGSGHGVYVRFYTAQREDVGAVVIHLSSPPEYRVWACNSSRTNFPSNLPSEVDKIWRITLDRTAGTRVKIHCNGVEVLNVLLSDSTCSDSYWRNYRSKDVEYIHFSVYDTASGYYRAGKQGK